jgi:hypothetical protein
VSNFPGRDNHDFVLSKCNWSINHKVLFVQGKRTLKNCMENFERRDCIATHPNTLTTKELFVHRHYHLATSCTRRCLGNYEQIIVNFLWPW